MKTNANQLVIPTYQIGMLQSRAYRAVSNRMTLSLQAYAISLPEWSVLGLLYGSDGVRPYRIARDLGVRPPVATAVMNGLESKKLLIRRPHPTDSRATIIVLTRKGRVLVGKVEAQLSKELRSFLNDVTIPEFVVYMRVLHKITAEPEG